MHAQKERYLRIYCPTHKITFPAVSASRIICESGGEALAQNFPYEEFWEYCCDCESFWPSGLARGIAAEDRCPVCNRESARRYLCNICKIVSCDSNESVRRKALVISQRGAIEPLCPGCLTAAPSALRRHRCDQAATEFATVLDMCPFCDESLKDNLREGGKTSSSRSTPDVNIHLQADQRQIADQGHGKTFPPQSGYESAVRLTPKPPPQSFASIPSEGEDTSSFASSSIAATIAPTSNGTRSFLIGILGLAVATIIVLAILLMRSGTQAVPSDLRSGSSTPLASPQTALNSPGRNSTAARINTTGTDGNLQQPMSANVSVAPTANAKLAYCRSNKVYLRSDPHLDETNKNLIKIINSNQKLWVLGTSSNYETTYIRSAEGMVTDNWTEVQLYDETSVHGWVFSYFVVY